jgi:hypothetical protein
MKNRSKIQSALKEMGLNASKIEYNNCRSEVVYGDSAPSGSWTVVLDSGQFYESSPDYDTVSDAVDVMLDEIRFDLEDSCDAHEHRQGTQSADSVGCGDLE